MVESAARGGGEFDGRVALVTGGSRGIGRAAALRLARDGADVAITYAERESAAREVAAEIEGFGRRATFCACDVSSPEAVEAAVRQVRADLGPIDLLAHCGAISNLCSHETLTLDQWRRMLDVNLTGTFLIVFAVKDEMIRRRYGRIVTVSSNAALGPRARQIHYSAAKAGVIAFTRCCAEAFAPHGVRINCLAPGLTETEMAHVLSEDAIRAIVERTPLGRVGQPEEMAGIIRFLLGDDSDFLTGQLITASGGRDMLQ